MNFVEKIKKHWLFSLVMLLLSLVAALALFKKDIRYLNPDYEKKVSYCNALSDELFSLSEDEIEISTNVHLANEIENIKKYNYNLMEIKKNNCESIEWIKSQAMTYKNKKMNYCYNLVDKWANATNKENRDKYTYFVNIFSKNLLSEFTRFPIFYSLNEKEIQTPTVTINSSQ